jgi:hypothetical protein
MTLKKIDDEEKIDDDEEKDSVENDKNKIIICVSKTKIM